MKGTILGFTAASGSGMITGEDGKRYSFSQAEWHSERAITATTAVDFEAHDGEAVGIYPIASASTAPDFSALASAPAVAKARSLATGTLAFPLAILILLACLLTALSTPRRSFNLFTLGDAAAQAAPMASSNGDRSQEIAEIDKEIAEVQQEQARLGSDATSPSYGFGSIGGRLKQLEDNRERTAKLAAGERNFGLVRSILFLRLAAPLASAWLIFACWARPGSTRLASLVAGGAAIVASVLPYFLKTAMIAALGNFGGGMDEAVGIGIGAWLILAAGIALILAGLGKIANPLAAKTA
jgi:hypothetical protein